MDCGLFNPRKEKESIQLARIVLRETLNNISRDESRENSTLQQIIKVVFGDDEIDLDAMTGVQIKHNIKKIMYLKQLVSDNDGFDLMPSIIQGMTDVVKRIGECQPANSEYPRLAKTFCCISPCITNMLQKLKNLESGRFDKLLTISNFIDENKSLNQLIIDVKPPNKGKIIGNAVFSCAFAFCINFAMDVLFTAKDDTPVVTGNYSWNLLKNAATETDSRKRKRLGGDDGLVYGKYQRLDDDDERTESAANELFGIAAANTEESLHPSSLPEKNDDEALPSPSADPQTSTDGGENFDLASVQRREDQSTLFLLQNLENENDNSIIVDDGGADPVATDSNNNGPIGDEGTIQPGREAYFYGDLIDTPCATDYLFDKDSFIIDAEERREYNNNNNEMEIFSSLDRQSPKEKECFEDDEKESTLPPNLEKDDGTTRKETDANAAIPHPFDDETVAKESPAMDDEPIPDREPLETRDEKESADEKPFPRPETPAVDRHSPMKEYITTDETDNFSSSDRQIREKENGFVPKCDEMDGDKDVSVTTLENTANDAENFQTLTIKREKKKKKKKKNISLVE